MNKDEYDYCLVVADDFLSERMADVLITPRQLRILGTHVATLIEEQRKLARDGVLLEETVGCSSCGVDTTRAHADDCSACHHGDVGPVVQSLLRSGLERF